MDAADGDLSSAAIGDPLIAALQQMTPDLVAGARLTVDPGRTRLNLLPLRQLLMGTALLFLALGVIMLATRKINWYTIGLSTSNEVSS